MQDYITHCFYSRSRRPGPFEAVVWRQTEIPNRKCGGRSLNWWLFTWFQYYWMFLSVLNTQEACPTESVAYSLAYSLLNRRCRLPYKLQYKLQRLVCLMAITRRLFWMPTLASKSTSIVRFSIEPMIDEQWRSGKNNKRTNSASSCHHCGGDAWQGACRSQPPSPDCQRRRINAVDRKP